MKKVLFVIFSICALASAAQDNQTQPFPGANVFFITTDNPDELNYREIGNFLHRNGLSIAQSNDEFYNIVTKHRSLKTKPSWSHVYFYDIVFYDGIIKIKPYWMPGIDIDFGSVTIRNEAYPWKYQKNGVNRFISEETYELFRSFSTNLIFGREE